MIFQRQEKNGLLIQIYVLTSKKSDPNFFSVVYINGTIKEFFLTVSREKMLSHHNLTESDIAFTRYSCPQFKENFSKTINTDQFVGMEVPN